MICPCTHFCKVTQQLCVKLSREVPVSSSTAAHTEDNRPFSPQLRSLGLNFPKPILWTGAATAWGLGSRHVSYINLAAKHPLCLWNAPPTWWGCVRVVTCEPTCAHVTKTWKTFFFYFIMCCPLTVFSATRTTRTHTSLRGDLALKYGWPNSCKLEAT